MNEPISYEKQTRYYSLTLERDLFHWVVVKRYGRIGAKVGQVRTIAFELRDEAEQFFQKEHERRIKRGYTVVGVH